MASIIGLIKRLYNVNNPPCVPNNSSTKALKFGILGAAAIAPAALILPARSHPDVIIYAVAARSLDRAQAFAKKHGIEKAYGNYQALLDDKEVDVIYNPLPNALHFEWTMRALAAGKHVLNEKPSADTAEETRQMFEFAEKKGLVLLDAYHYRFHPALHRAKEIIESGELGRVKHVEMEMVLTRGMFGDEDIRYDYSLGGGALMDLGCYTMNCIQYISSSRPTEVIAAKAVVHVPKGASASYVRNVDRKTVATVALPNDATATMTCDLSSPHKYGFIPIMPRIKMRVDLKVLGENTRVEKVYRGKIPGEEWWTTYRFQLEALVDQVRGRKAATWLEKEDSVKTMEWIEKIYEETGLGARPKSDFDPLLI